MIAKHIDANSFILPRDTCDIWSTLWFKIVDNCPRPLITFVNTRLVSGVRPNMHAISRELGKLTTNEFSEHD